MNEIINLFTKIQRLTDLINKLKPKLILLGDQKSTALKRLKESILTSNEIEFINSELFDPYLEIPEFNELFYNLTDAIDTIQTENNDYVTYEPRLSSTDNDDEDDDDDDDDDDEPYEQSSSYGNRSVPRDDDDDDDDDEVTTQSLNELKANIYKSLTTVNVIPWEKREYYCDTCGIYMLNNSKRNHVKTSKHKLNILTLQSKAVQTQAV